MNEWNPFEEQPKLESVHVAGVDLRAGDRVRLCPRKTADIMDLALQGQIAVIESIEQDYEEQVHLAVILDNDPGRDLGALRQPGHRFFFSPEEIEPVEESESDANLAASDAPAEQPAKFRVLVAGIGNIFLGDDAFGVEVIRRLANKLPESVRVEDFGIRGFDLAYALMDDYEAVILVDAVPRQGAPGTLYTIEPDLRNLQSPDSAFEAHSLDPVKVLAFAQSMGAKLNHVLVVGCEPASLEEDEGGRIGLSLAVEQATEEAAQMVQELVAAVLRESPQDSVAPEIHER
ncbi:MAG TPA: hydrogenase maturation protease [Candidatus Acidoferrales bacterium]|jgi:hydrogenase maturation protease|nr:hydrogenase maturation protease [Candidatus Acidoferrales bacterium]